MNDAANETAAPAAPKTRWATCHCCGWAGLKVRKNGTLPKHGRQQTGNAGRGCEGSGQPARD